jgi:hypothetical protein
MSFIDPPLGGFGDISLSDDIFLGAKPLVGNITPNPPRSGSINDNNYPVNLRFLAVCCIDIYEKYNNWRFDEFMFVFNFCLFYISSARVSRSQ